MFSGFHDLCAQACKSGGWQGGRNREPRSWWSAQAFGHPVLYFKHPTHAPLPYPGTPIQGTPHPAIQGLDRNSKKKSL